MKIQKEILLFFTFLVMVFNLNGQSTQAFRNNTKLSVSDESECGIYVKKFEEMSRRHISFINGLKKNPQNINIYSLEKLRKEYDSMTGSSSSWKTCTSDMKYALRIMNATQRLQSAYATAGFH